MQQGWPGYAFHQLLQHGLFRTYEILVNGADPAEMPIQYAEEVTLKYNKEVAELIEWEIPSDMVAIEES